MSEWNIWEINVLLFADDSVLIADSKEKLRDLVLEFERVCQGKGLKINPSKSKVMLISPKPKGDDSRPKLDTIMVIGEGLTEISVFRYLGMDVGAFGGLNEEIDHRVAEGERVLSSLRELWKKGNLSKKIKMNLFDCTFVPTVLYGCETWELNAKLKRRIEVLEMKGLRNICGVKRSDRIRNARIRYMCS